MSDGPFFGDRVEFYCDAPEDQDALNSYMIGVLSDVSYIAPFLEHYYIELEKILEPFRRPSDHAENGEYDIPPSAPPEIRDADEAMTCLKCLKTILDADGDVELPLGFVIRQGKESKWNAGIAGFKLGELLRKLGFRKFEKEMEREIRRKEKLDARNAERAKLGAKIVEAVDEQIEQGRSSGHEVTVRGACRTIAKRELFIDDNGEHLDENRIRNYYRKHK